MNLAPDLAVSSASVLTCASLSEAARCVRSFRDRSPEKDWRVPCKLPKHAPKKTKRIAPRPTIWASPARALFRSCNIHRCPMALTSLECRVSESASSDACPRPAAQPGAAAAAARPRAAGQGATQPEPAAEVCVCACCSFALAQTGRTGCFILILVRDEDDREAPAASIDHCMCCAIFCARCAVINDVQCI